MKKLRDPKVLSALILIIFAAVCLLKIMIMVYLLGAFLIGTTVFFLWKMLAMMLGDYLDKETKL